MPRERHSALEIVNDWIRVMPSMNEKFWTKTVGYVEKLKSLHQPDVMPLTLPSRSKICVQSLKIVEWTLAALNDKATAPTDPEEVRKLSERLEKVLRLFADVIRPLNLTLISDIPNIVILRKIMDRPELANLYDICLDILITFVNEDPNIVMAVTKEIRTVPCNENSSTQTRSFNNRRENQRRRNDHSESRLILRNVRREKFFREPLPSETCSYFGEGCMSLGQKTPDSSELLSQLSSLRFGAQVETSSLHRLMFVLPAARGNDSAVGLSDVHTEHLLANIVALLNAPERQWQSSVLAIGICPHSRRAMGVNMNYNDQDAFRIGFDQTVLRRVRPSPTADCLRLQFIPLKAAPPSHTWSGEGQARADSERRQKVRRPTLIVIEVQKILFAEWFAFEDFDTKNRRSVHVRTVPQGDGIRVLDRVNDLRCVAAQAKACLLRRELEEVDQELANLKRI